MNFLSKYFHTIRYLHPRQTLGRVWFRVRRKRANLSPTPPIRRVARAWTMPIAGERSLYGPELFRLLNREGRCSRPADWCTQNASKLWRYHLHYFDDLNAKEAGQRSAWHRDLLERWVAENPVGRGDGWEPYPTSLRIVNWIKWGLAGNTFSDPVLHSLAVQARWLSQNIEYHILGNHLFSNAKALMYAGLYFDGPEADAWRRLGFTICAEQLPRQLLPDGGHFELSPMYHALFIEDILDLINVHSAFATPAGDRWARDVESAFGWLRTLCHPDGEIAFFNDAAFGHSPSAADIASYAERLGLHLRELTASQSRLLPESGYVRVIAEDVCLLCDCARIGPDHLPAHGHADTLSFELSVGNRRVFVNSGTSLYGVGAERQRQRGTAAHNTVVVDEHDSSEVWGGFRAARRARVTYHKIDLSRPSVVDASHDGYCRLPGKNRHRRRWTMRDRSLVIEDWVDGTFREAHAFFHIHPDVTANKIGPDEVELRLSSGRQVLVRFTNNAAVRLERGTWHPEFGVSLDNYVIRTSFSDTSLTTEICWAAL